MGYSLVRHVRASDGSPRMTLMDHETHVRSVPERSKINLTFFPISKMHCSPVLQLLSDSLEELERLV